jgi:N-acetylmuramoyl-L-alanine amidase
MTFRARSVIAVVTVVLLGPAGLAAAQPARDLYTQAMTRDRAVRDARQASNVRQIRAAIAAYERVVRRYPTSGYSDNALWQAAELARLAWERFGDDVDRRAGIRLLNQLKAGYPSSSLVSEIDPAIAKFETTKVAAAPPKPAAPSPQTPIAPAEAPITPAADKDSKEKTEAAPGAIVTVRGITRTALPDGIRVTIEMDRELLFHQEQLEKPRRLFFDLRGALLSPALRGKPLSYQDDIVREIRVGLHPQNTTRVVMDTEGVESYSVFTLYNPYRLIVDFRRQGAPAALLSPLAVPAVVPTTGIAVTAALPRKMGTSVAPPSPPAPLPAAPVVPPPVVSGPPGSLPSREVVAPTLPAPALPSANSNGEFSLSRQLGLGVSRVVIDPGHGGHDPGASGNGVNEAELVLDVSLRLKKLLEKAPGTEVVMTRETDVYIPLEQRTAIANRESADLFLSVHANASRNPKARGVETYFLNFAANPEAEAVAARENSSSGQTMHRLPDIVRAIALNNKLDESRDFAEMIQKSMVRKLSSRNRDLRDLGVKQAPFVVLIGAGMPSVLAEISFVTHKQEGLLLKTAAYRQQIAEALFDAIAKYQKSLKTKTTVASRDE